MHCAHTQDVNEKTLKKERSRDVYLHISQKMLLFLLK